MLKLSYLFYRKLCSSTSELYYLFKMSSEQLRNGMNTFDRACLTKDSASISQGLNSMNSIIDSNTLVPQDPVQATSGSNSSQQPGLK